jgi:hypothetical protein
VLEGPRKETSTYVPFAKPFCKHFSCRRRFHGATVCCRWSLLPFCKQARGRCRCPLLSCNQARRSVMQGTTSLSQHILIRIILIPIIVAQLILIPSPACRDGVIWSPCPTQLVKDLSKRSNRMFPVLRLGVDFDQLKHVNISCPGLLSTQLVKG